MASTPLSTSLYLCAFVISVLCSLVVLTSGRSIEGCPESWVKHRNACYFHSNERTTWKNARFLCASLDGQADLVSIHNAEEQAYLADSIIPEVWVGLYYDHYVSNWKWSYNNKRTSIVDLPFTNNTTDKLKHNCSCVKALQVKSKEESTAKLELDNCSKHRKFVCHAKLSGSCKSGWTPFMGYCYKVSEKKTRWIDARRYCKSWDPAADLADLDVERRDTLLAFLSGLLHCSKWTGLNALTDNTTWQWSDGTTVDYDKWSYTKPILTEEKCVEVSFKGSHSTWTTRNCNASLFYFCKRPMLPTETACPAIVSEWNQKWHRFGNHCIRNVWFQSWKKGEDRCKELDPTSSLVSIHSAEEEKFIIDLYYKVPAFREVTNGSFWIGLNFQSDAGTWRYSDGSPADYFNWWDDEPTVNNEQSKCAELNLFRRWTNEPAWNNVDCDSLNYFSCKMSHRPM